MSPARTGFGAYAGEPHDLSLREAADYLGLTLAQIILLIEGDGLYAFRVGRRLHLPMWQSANHGAVPHLGQVLAMLAPMQLHPMTVAGFMTTPSDELDDKTPVEWLTGGGAVQPVLFAATALQAW